MLSFRAGSWIVNENGLDQGNNSMPHPTKQSPISCVAVGLIGNPISAVETFSSRNFSTL